MYNLCFKNASIYGEFHLLNPGGFVLNLLGNLYYSKTSGECEEEGGGGGWLLPHAQT